MGCGRWGMHRTRWALLSLIALPAWAAPAQDREPEKLPAAAGVHEIRSTSHPELRYWVHVPKAYRPGSPIPLLISYGKHYEDAAAEIRKWAQAAEAGPFIAVGTTIGKNDWSGHVDLSEEIFDRANRSYTLNPYAVCLTCRGVDHILPTLLKRPDLFRYAAQRDGWKQNYQAPQLSDDQRKLLAASHAWHKMRWGTLDAAYDEEAFKKASECFGALGLKSLKMDRREQYGDGSPEVAAWFKEKLAQDQAVLAASLAADKDLQRARELVKAGKHTQALDLLRKRVKGGAILPQAKAKVEREIEALEKEPAKDK